MHLCLKSNNEIRIEFCEWYRLERRIQRARRENDLSSRQRKTGMPRTRSYDSVRGTQTDMRIEYEPSFFVDVAVKYPRSCHVVVRSSVLFDTPVLTESIYFERWHSWLVQRGCIYVPPSRAIWVRTFRECGHGLSEGFGFEYPAGPQVTFSVCLLSFFFYIWKDDPETFKAYLLDKYTWIVTWNEWTCLLRDCWLQTRVKLAGKNHCYN